MTHACLVKRFSRKVPQMILLAAALGSPGASAQAAPAMALKWETLVPPTPPLESFFEALPSDQQQALENYDLWMSFPQGQINKQAAEAREQMKNAVDADRPQLARQGVDIDALYRKYQAWNAEVERRGKLTDQRLNGKRVALAGYLLPLDFNPDGTTEFLLVPFVGACIHVPPPPPNQVVHVTNASPYKVQDLFDGVMVTGTMAVQPGNNDLSLVDGSNDVESAYVLKGEMIQPYTYTEEGQ